MRKSAVVAVVVALSLLLAGTAVTPGASHAAAWISGADSFASDWVKRIEQEFAKKDYRYVFANDPRTPQASVLRLLHRAAEAHAANQDELASKLTREAIDVLREGVRKHYYDESDVAPLMRYIAEQAPVKIS